MKEDLERIKIALEVLRATGPYSGAACTDDLYKSACKVLQQYLDPQLVGDNKTPVPNGYGYTCPFCHLFVFPNTTHSCSNPIG